MSIFTAVAPETWKALRGYIQAFKIEHPGKRINAVVEHERLLRAEGLSSEDIYFLFKKAMSLYKGDKSCPP